MTDMINRTTGQSPYDGLTINKEDVKEVTKVNVKKSVGSDGVCCILQKCVLIYFVMCFPHCLHGP